MKFNIGDKVGVEHQGWWHGTVEKVAKNGALTVRWGQAPLQRYIGTCDRFTADGRMFGSTIWSSAQLE